MDLYSAFPRLVVEHHAAGARIFGSISVSGQSFTIHIETTSSELLMPATVLYGWETLQALVDIEEIVKQRQARSRTVLEFLTELQEMLRQIRATPVSKAINASSYRALISELGAIGWDNVRHVSDSLTELALLSVDQVGRQHTMNVQLATRAGERNSVSTDLPEHVSPPWGEETLSALYLRFKAAISACQELWAVLDEIAECTWVLDSARPPFSSTTRRVALTGNSSVQLEVNAQVPHSMPECRFLGPDKSVAALRVQYFQFMDNMRAMLGRDAFPPPTLATEGLGLECGICYAMHAGDDMAIPDKVCEDARCGKAYHRICLVEWLRTLPSTRQSFDSLFGECPYCSRQITVKALVHS